MKAVLMSIKPYWVFLIIAKAMGWNIDQKTVEVRKSYPKDKNWDSSISEEIQSLLFTALKKQGA